MSFSTSNHFYRIYMKQGFVIKIYDDLIFIGISKNVTYREAFIYYSNA
ncbi:hypothetical protein LEP1GSC065_3267 [Leptospira kirschneri serovar Sokoine str. RM1]|nr:hypothetical protein LEP1GSC065_3267 [Leptospira kirschneri serovar Sokoine str. RM1]